MAPTLDRHVVTAVLVAHDGARWLPEALKALLTQARPVQRLVTVDTGSRDRGPAVLAEVLGGGDVLTLPRTTGYGEAVAEALRQDAASAPVPDDEPGNPRTEWIWLLHDDCVPDHDALGHLLRTAGSDPGIAVIGPKIRDFGDRRVLREAGTSVDAAGRRWTGIDRREFDQGQHDGVRDVLAVSSAGMLVRRDVWDRLGGFDVEYGIFRDDLDFCWRAHAAGHRVVVATDAVVYHAEAARRGIREIGMTAEHPLRRDRRNALWTLLANQPFRAMLRTLVRNVWASLVHALVLVATKRPAAARAELAALADVLRDPGRLRRARATRAEGRAHVHRSVRRFQPRMVVLRRTGEAVSEFFAAHEHDREAEDEITDEPGPIRRLLARPGVLLLLALAAVTIAAERSLITGAARLGGGALVPAWGGASDLWEQYLSGFHPVGLGTGAGGPPYVGFLAVLSTVLFGKPWLAVAVLLLGSVPLAGLTAYRASRLLVLEPPRTGRRARAEGRRIPVAAVRVWFAAAYALLPAATGAIAGGRLGTAVVLVLLPLIGVQVARMYGLPRFAADPATLRKRAGRAAWAVALLLTVATAFVPLAWPLALAGGGLVWALFDRRRRQDRRNLVIALAAPPLLLFPWTVGLLLHPSRFLLEAGLHRTFEPATAADLLALNPGGPGAPVWWTFAGLFAAAVCALPLRGRRTAVLAGWLLAVAGLLVAILTGAATITKGADAAPAWPGVALVFAGAGVLLAATAAVQRGTEVLAGKHLIYKAGGAVVVLAALTAPLLAAGAWVARGADGPLGTVDADTVPEFVKGQGGPRTLVLHGGGPSGRVAYTLLRGDRPRLGEAETQPGGPGQRRLDDLVAGLAVNREGDDGPALSRMGVQYVLVPHPGSDPVTKVLDAAPELTRLSRTGSFAVWTLQANSARMMLLQGSTITPLPAGEIDARVRIPAGTGARTLLLAEPADGGWHARLNGHGLKSRTVDGWAQGYDIPTSGGEFTLTRGMGMRHAWLIVQGVALLLVAVLALPGAPADTFVPGGDRNRERRERRGRRAKRGGHRARVRHEPPAQKEPAPEPDAKPETEPEAEPVGEPVPQPVASEEQS
ncbi:glycosyltransferase [Actinomadura verrucosospora]|uniref:Glycosyl transferase family 2 protein n=1 Tax=Actinomadura verrucosospora TaxID=46165 RepID=A0A7D3VZV1_ACTVE|nr:glycosyltransferase [Actinomadura verrucosospora]QKG25134.1 glycosyl transferase family 2 protein [Actinomadura verrucosospora]